jgi:hypothetical protein
MIERPLRFVRRYPNSELNLIFIYGPAGIGSNRSSTETGACNKPCSEQASMNALMAWAFGATP